LINRNLPNIITIIRILLLPFFITTLVYGDYKYALIIFITASVTDVLDGLVARMTGNITIFGSILDPVADKFLLITSFIIMSVYDWIPKWLTIIVISRDVIIVTGWLILFLATHNPKVQPSILGKSTNALQFILVGLILMVRALNISHHVPYILFIILALLTSVSGLHYVYMGLKMANMENE
jgi:cardiolipin synthase